MAAAMARGLRDDVDGLLFTDSGSGRATALAAELGGESVATNRELAERADVVVLAVKPARLYEVAGALGGAKAVVSLLGATSLETVREALPSVEVVRVMPNLAVEVRRGVLCVSGVRDLELRSLLEGLGQVVELPDSQFDAATAVMGCAPAYLALAIRYDRLFAALPSLPTLQVVAILLVGRTLINIRGGLYGRRWRFASVPDLQRIVVAVDLVREAVKQAVRALEHGARPGKARARHQGGA